MLAWKLFSFDVAAGDPHFIDRLVMNQQQFAVGNSVHKKIMCKTHDVELIEFFVSDKDVVEGNI